MLINEIIFQLKIATKNMPEPMVSQIVKLYGRDPFLILISCLLSLRSRDTATFPIVKNLFSLAKTPAQILNISINNLEIILKSLGFYKRKAQVLHNVSLELLNNFNNTVPNTLDSLLSLPGVGLKTANLVLGEAFNIPAICVDIHVHRISNRLGLVNTKTPEETENDLKKILPKKYWIEFNRLLVTWGQNICLPVTPRCSTCVLSNICPKISVKKSR